MDDVDISISIFLYRVLEIELRGDTDASVNAFSIPTSLISSAKKREAFCCPSQSIMICYNET